MFAVDWQNWGLVEWVKALIVLGGLFAILWVLCKYVFEWTPPQWLIKIFWIVIGVLVGVAAVNVISRM